MKKNKIFEFRTAKGYTQRQLATILAMPYQQIQRWENGERVPSVYNAISLAKALNTTVEALFEFEEN